MLPLRSTTITSHFYIWELGEHYCIALHLSCFTLPYQCFNNGHWLMRVFVSNQYCNIWPLSATQTFTLSATCSVFKWWVGKDTSTTLLPPSIVILNWNTPATDACFTLGFCAAASGSVDSCGLCYVYPYKMVWPDRFYPNQFFQDS